MPTLLSLVNILAVLESLPPDVRALPVGFIDEEGYTSFVARFIIDLEKKNVLVTSSKKIYSRSGDDFISTIKGIMEKYPGTDQFTMSCSVMPMRMDEGNVVYITAPATSATISVKFICLNIDF